MGHIYFIRHGESQWNVEDKICGATDVPLTEKGHEQAIITGKKFLELGYTADVIQRGIFQGKAVLYQFFRQRRIHVPRCPARIQSSG